MRIGIIAASPGELRPLVRGWKKQHSVAKGLSMWRVTHGEDELIAVCGGMGAAAAMRSFTAAESIGPLELVLSVGWAGALDSGMRTGQCYIPSEVIDAQTGERFQLTDGKRKQCLITTPEVANTSEKRRLWQSYGAVLVDMEAATIARQAQMRNIPLCCFKAVSDGPDAVLPDLNRFINKRGHLNLLPFLAHVLVRPKFWKPLIKLARNSAFAAKAIALKVQKFLPEKNVHRVNKTGAV